MINAFRDPFPIEKPVPSTVPTQHPIEVVQESSTSQVLELGSSEWEDVDSDEELLDVDEANLQDTMAIDNDMDLAVDSLIQKWNSDSSNSIYVRRNSCIAHLLQLGIKSALKNSAVDGLIKKVNGMITWFNKSNKELALLKEKTKLGFIKPCDTRWNATYMCLKRLCTEIEISSATEDGESTKVGTTY